MYNKVGFKWVVKYLLSPHFSLIFGCIMAFVEKFKNPRHMLFFLLHYSCTEC